MGGWAGNQFHVGPLIMGSIFHDVYWNGLVDHSIISADFYQKASSL